MKIIIIVLFILAASISAVAQTKESKKAKAFDIASTGLSVAATFYDWKQAHDHAGELRGTSAASAVYRCESNSLYRSSNGCTQSSGKYWTINGGLIVFTSYLKYRTHFHLFGDTLDIGFGAIHFASARGWNSSLPMIPGGKFRK